MPGLSDAEKSELETLTVVNGQMVCVRHIPFAGKDHSQSLTNAVLFESGGTTSNLSTYQEDRGKADEEMWASQGEEFKAKG